MKGEIKRIIDLIISTRSRGDPVLASLTRTKLILEGFNPSRYSPDLDDDISRLERLKQLAKNYEVDI